MTAAVDEERRRPVDSASDTGQEVVSHSLLESVLFELGREALDVEPERLRVAQQVLAAADLIAYGEQLGLDLERFTDDLRTHSGAARVAEDVDSADLSGVSGTPTFFINGRRHRGAYDIRTLSVAVRAAGAQAVLATTTS